MAEAAAAAAAAAADVSEENKKVYLWYACHVCIKGTFGNIYGYCAVAGRSDAYHTGVSSTVVQR